MSGTADPDADSRSAPRCVYSSCRPHPRSGGPSEASWAWRPLLTERGLILSLASPQGDSPTAWAALGLATLDSPSPIGPGCGRRATGDRGCGHWGRSLGPQREPLGGWRSWRGRPMSSIRTACGPTSIAPSQVGWPGAPSSSSFTTSCAPDSADSFCGRRCARVRHSGRESCGRRYRRGGPAPPSHHPAGRGSGAVSTRAGRPIVEGPAEQPAGRADRGGSGSRRSREGHRDRGAGDDDAPGPAGRSHLAVSARRRWTTAATRPGCGWRRQPSSVTARASSVRSKTSPAVLRSLDVLVNASASEPFGLTVLEAQACGVPVIGTDAGGIPEFVTDGETGLLVAPGRA